MVPCTAQPALLLSLNRIRSKSGFSNRAPDQVQGSPFGVKHCCCAEVAIFCKLYFFILESKCSKGMGKSQHWSNWSLSLFIYFPKIDFFFFLSYFLYSNLFTFSHPELHEQLLEADTDCQIIFKKWKRTHKNLVCFLNFFFFFLYNTQCDVVCFCHHAPKKHG